MKAALSLAILTAAAAAASIPAPAGAQQERVRRLVDDPPRYLNTALFLRTMLEISAITLVAKVVFSRICSVWEAGLITAGSMILVSYVVWGVAPRTLGRQHSDRFAIVSAGPVMAVTRILGPLPKVLIMLGNALTPGKGFAEGPFATEAELRALVDYAEKSAVIESGERQMIHSVFALGDTIAREVMVPRTEMVWIEGAKTLQQGLVLFLRSGFSRIPVIGESVDDVLGVLYLKDVVRRTQNGDPAAGATLASSASLRWRAASSRWRSASNGTSSRPDRTLSLASRRPSPPGRTSADNGTSARCSASLRPLP